VSGAPGLSIKPKLYLDLNLGARRGHCCREADTRATLGAFLEIMDYDNWRATHEALLRAGRDWDGQTDPVRPWSRLAEYAA